MHLLQTFRPSENTVDLQWALIILWKMDLQWALIILWKILQIFSGPLLFLGKYCRSLVGPYYSLENRLEKILVALSNPQQVFFRYSLDIPSVFFGISVFPQYSLGKQPFGILYVNVFSSPQYTVQCILYKPQYSLCKKILSTPLV